MEGGRQAGKERGEVDGLEVAKEGKNDGEGERRESY